MMPVCIYEYVSGDDELGKFDLLTVSFNHYFAERDKILDVHFVQFFLYHALFTVCNSHIPVILKVLHQVFSGNGLAKGTTKLRKKTDESIGRERCENAGEKY
jgi:hypothetical protein